MSVLKQLPQFHRQILKTRNIYPLACNSLLNTGVDPTLQLTISSFSWRGFLRTIPWHIQVFQTATTLHLSNKLGFARCHLILRGDQCTCLYDNFPLHEDDNTICYLKEQEAQLSPSDRAMRLVSRNLANCHATVQKLLIRQVLTKPMVWSWRFSRRQCVINNVHSTMTRPSRLPLSQVS